MIRKIVSLLLGLWAGVGSTTPLFAQTVPRAGFAYYDVDYLYDTIPSPFYDDQTYTPEGAKRWDTARYHDKLDRAAALIAELKMPLVGLYGVENETIVKELILRSEQPYSYVHLTLNALDGMDFALLYHGDRLLVEHVASGWGHLLIEGVLDGRPIAILLVAPVLREDHIVEYYLPQGTWTHLLTGEPAEGGRWCKESYDYFSLPLFVRENTLLPVGANEEQPAYDYLHTPTHCRRAARHRPPCTMSPGRPASPCERHAKRTPLPSPWKAPIRVWCWCWRARVTTGRRLKPPARRLRWPTAGFT